MAKAIAEEGVTVLNGVPATYQRLLEEVAFKDFAIIADVVDDTRGPIIGEAERFAKRRIAPEQTPDLGPVGLHRLRQRLLAHTQLFRMSIGGNDAYIDALLHPLQQFLCRIHAGFGRGYLALGRIEGGFFLIDLLVLLFERK
jgi:hypothetical protein